MHTANTLRGMSTVSFWADNVQEAAAWYTNLLGIEPYFVRPNAKEPEYVEFRIGDYEHELGIISKKYAPKAATGEPGGAVLYWHVDDIDTVLKQATDMGAVEYEPRIEREAGFITASVLDPFGNILGLMYSPHYLETLAKHQ